MRSNKTSLEFSLARISCQGIHLENIYQNVVPTDHSVQSGTVICKVCKDVFSIESPRQGRLRSCKAHDELIPLKRLDLTGYWVYSR